MLRRVAGRRGRLVVLAVAAALAGVVVGVGLAAGGGGSGGTPVTLAASGGGTAPSTGTPPTSADPPTTAATSAPTSTAAPTTVTTSDGAEYGLPPLPAAGDAVPPGAIDAVRGSVDVPGTVAVFGDSLALQSWTYLGQIASDRGGAIAGGAYGGVALCDWLPKMAEVLADAQVGRVVLAFAGNNITPCVAMPDGSRAWGADLVERYERDVAIAIATARARALPVTLVGPPRMLDGQWDGHAAGLRDAYRTIADRQPDVDYVDAAAVLSPGGFAARLPCAPYETSGFGCAADGTIEVRDPDGTHFAAPSPQGYAAGAWRYAAVVLSRG